MGTRGKGAGTLLTTHSVGQLLLLAVETGCQAGAGFISLQAWPAEEYVGTKVHFSMRGCCSPGQVSAGAAGGRTALEDQPVALTPCLTRGHLLCSPFLFIVWQEGAEMLISVSSRQVSPATLPILSSAGAAACWPSSHRSPSCREAHGSAAVRQLARSPRCSHTALLRQDGVTELILPVSASTLPVEYFLALSLV